LRTFTETASQSQIKEESTMRSWVVWLVCAALAPLGAAPAGAEPGSGSDSYPDSPVYQKPFLAKGSKVAVGGYIDLEFFAGTRSTFTQHRFVPFIAAQISDRLHLASEIEFEYGGDEIKVEFATLDFTLADPAIFRAGLVLMPVGQFNAVHDSPAQTLTERPLVDRYVIPTTWSEAGLGFYGDLYPSENLLVSYQVYAVNGLDQGTVDVVDGVLTPRSGRGSAEADNNNARGATGRVALSPRLGMDFGLSGYVGNYADQDLPGRTATLGAVDFNMIFGAFTLLGEGAILQADYPPTTGGEALARNAGFYVEGRFHTLQGAVHSLPQSMLVPTVRVDYIDYDRNVTGADEEKLTFGLPWKPGQETVFKNDFILQKERPAGSEEWSDVEFVYAFSMATYF
jgi:hypothetical protein